MRDLLSKVNPNRGQCTGVRSDDGVAYGRGRVFLTRVSADGRWPDSTLNISSSTDKNQSYLLVVFSKWQSDCFSPDLPVFSNFSTMSMYDVCSFPVFKGMFLLDCTGSVRWEMELLVSYVLQVARQGPVGTRWEGPRTLM